MKKLNVVASRLAVIFAITWVAGCSSEPPTSSSEVVDPVDLPLKIGRATQINTVRYTMTGPNGFSRSGSFDVARLPEIEGELSNVPAGGPYTLALNASSTDGNVTCSGSKSGIFVACPGSRKQNERAIHLTCSRNHLGREWGDRDWRSNGKTFFLGAEVHFACTADAGAGGGEGGPVESGADRPEIGTTDAGADRSESGAIDASSDAAIDASSDAAKDASDASPEACVPATCPPPSLGCGPFPDGCGGTLSCGCPNGQTCSADRRCECHPFCTGSKTCGVILDDCNEPILCGTCPGGQVCGSDNQCHSPVSDGCVPLTACPAGQNCGTASDGCGNTINCGSCPQGLTCNISAGSTSGACGPPNVVSQVTGLSVGSAFACAVTANGGVDCWGSNFSGELGNASVSAAFSSLPVPVSGLNGPVVGVSAGAGFACAVTASGGVECWGDNASGRLGSGSIGGTHVAPAQVVGLTSGVTVVEAGDFSACALTAGGSVVCWGDNSDGLLGNGSTTTSAVPVPVVGLANGATAVSVGLQSACAIIAGGGVVCWGDNTYGELGNGSTTSSSVPVPVSGLGSGAIAVSVGDYSACAITAAGAVVCWGAEGALGSPPTTVCLNPPPLSGGFPCTPVPAQVPGLSSGATRVSVGDHSACAVVNGGAQCWGIDDLYGVLGNGSTASSVAPVQVTSLSSGVADVSVLGDPSACALTTSGVVFCWGDNRYGELGNGSTTNSSMPVPVLCGSAVSCGPCVAMAPAQACGAATCGTSADGCGHLLSCGICGNGQTCQAGQCFDPSVGCAITGTTASCLASRDKPGEASCSQCVVDHGCLDPARFGAPCEGATNQFHAAVTLPDGRSCTTSNAAGGSVLVAANESEAQMCLQALGTIFGSQCATDLSVTPCICGGTTIASCVNGAAPPTGPLYDLAACDEGTTNGHILASLNFTSQAYGIGRANSIAQCAALNDCNCF